MFESLLTPRLILRQFTLEDAKRVKELAGSKEVAKNTLGMPYPYHLEAATSWINTHQKIIESGDAFPLAIVLRQENVLIGTMTLRVDKIHSRGELGYWVGKEYWGNKYATEAAKEIIRFGFEELGLNRVWGMAMAKNHASVKVMQNSGLLPEGILKQHAYQFNVYEDICVLGLTKDRFEY